MDIKDGIKVWRFISRLNTTHQTDKDANPVWSKSAMAALEAGEGNYAELCLYSDAPELRNDQRWALLACFDASKDIEAYGEKLANRVIGDSGVEFPAEYPMGNVDLELETLGKARKLLHISVYQWYYR